MTQTYTFDIERVRLEDGQLIMSAIAATLEEDLEDFEVTVQVDQVGDGAFRAELAAVEAFDFENFCEGLGITDGPDVAQSLAANGFSIWKEASYPQDLDANGTFGYIIERRVS